VTYVTKSCPSCGKSYSVGQPKKSGFYGSPFRRCVFCGGTFIDKEYREIAVSGIREVDKRRVSLGTALFPVIPSFFILVGIYCGIVLGFDSRSLLFICGGLVFLFLSIYLIRSEAKDFDNRQKFLKEEAARSESRLSNPEYALALRRIGYKVPDKYLPDFTK